MLNISVYLEMLRAEFYPEHLGHRIIFFTPEFVLLFCGMELQLSVFTDSFAWTLTCSKCSSVDRGSPSTGTNVSVNVVDLQVKSIKNSVPCKIQQEELSLNCLLLCSSLSRYPHG